MDLLKKLDAVLAHLNSEENELALEFREELSEYIEESSERSLWLMCLEDAGVDNWSGIDFAHDLRNEAMEAAE
jgi:hypothetical protein